MCRGSAERTAQTLAAFLRDGFLAQLVERLGIEPVGLLPLPRSDLQPLRRTLQSAHFTVNRLGQFSLQVTDSDVLAQIGPRSMLTHGWSFAKIIFKFFTSGCWNFSPVCNTMASITSLMEGF